MLSRISGGILGFISRSLPSPPFPPRVLNMSAEMLHGDLASAQVALFASNCGLPLKSPKYPNMALNTQETIAI